MRILCLGSLNMDYIYQVSHIVQPGETLTSEKLDVLSGGKGLNQAIAMGRTGMNVCLAGRIGADGQWLLDGLETYGVDASRVQTVDVSTGKAIKLVYQQNGLLPTRLIPILSNNIFPV